MAAGTVVGLFMVAGAIASIYYGKGSERGSPRRQQSNAMFWSFMGGAFAAGTPLLAGGAASGGGTGAAGAGAGGAAAGTAAVTSAEVGTAAAGGAGAGAASTAAVTSGLAPAAGGGFAMEMTVAASAVPPVVASTAPQMIAGVGAGAGSVGANLVYGEAPQETWWQRMRNEQQPREKGKASDWLEDIGQPSQQRDQDETIQQPPAPEVDYRAIAQEQERRRVHEETIGQQTPIPEGRHGEKRWGDWWGNPQW